MRKIRGNKPRLQKILVLFFVVLIIITFAALLYKSLPNIVYLATGNRDSVLVVPKITSSTQNDFENALEDYNISVENIMLASDSATLIVALTTGTYVYFDFTKMATKQVKSLSAILQRLSIEGRARKPSVIDLRYTNPIIKF